jgi:hypothetical protein
VGKVCGTHGRDEKCVKSFGGEAWRKIPFGRPRHRWEDGIRMDLVDIVWGWGCGVDSFGSGLGPVADSCECGEEPLGFGTT